MIQLTRINGTKLTINALLIETIEDTPDSIITLVNGKKYIVLETAEEISSLTAQYLQSIGVFGGTLKSLNSEGS